MNITDHSVHTTDEHLYSIDGLNPQGNGSGFTITLNGDVADALRELDVPEKQTNLREHLVESFFDTDSSLDDQIATVRFLDDSPFLTNITVGLNATGLDHIQDRGGNAVYATHNVDTPEQAMKTLAVFTTWIDFATAILTTEHEPVEDNRERDANES